MKRATLLLVAMLAALLTAGGVALAAPKTVDPDTLTPPPPPNDFDSATETEHGMDTRIGLPGSGVMVHLAGISVFASDGSYTHRGAGEFALEEEGNLVIPPKADAALCEALQH